MPAVHLDHVSYGYTSAIDVISDADVHIGPGWTGVIGGNGSGKTTLLRLIVGHLRPTGGRVRIDPAAGVVVLCEQTVEPLSDETRAFAYSWEGPDTSLRGRLGLDADDLDRWGTLSPGERKRWQIGTALSQHPDILLLDEPTNHLDTEARTMLVDALRLFGGVGLVVSHDRSLLEALTRKSLRVHLGAVTLWNGAYRAASQGWTTEEREAHADLTRLKAEANRAQKRLADLRRVNEQKRAAFRRTNNTTSFKDIDARSAARGSKHADGEKAAAKALAAAADANDRASAALSSVSVAKDLGGDLFLHYQPSPKRVITAHNGALEAGGRTIVEDVDVVVERSTRLWVRGRNGVGKTTLLRSLVGTARLPPDRLLWLEQELTNDQVSDLLAQLGGLERSDRGRVLSLVATLGVDPEVLLASESPSPGEARKLAMALGLGRSAWLVVLDEPTNHLDIPSIERLETALAAYPGALVVVTHDEEFARELGLAEIELG